MDDSDDVEVEYEVETIDIGTHRFHIHTIAFLPIEILMRNQTNGVEISGQKLWCGSAAIMQYVLDRPEILPNNTILELGAGTGILGMMCHRLGCKNVILTDNDQRSLDHMSIDCLTNDVDASVVKLDWFDFAIDQFNSLKVDGRLIIVAGDVLYKKTLLDPFFNVISQLFERYQRNVEMYLCHVPRADNKQTDILAAISVKGFQVKEIDSLQWRKGVCTSLSPEDDYNRAALYHITPRDN